MASRMQSAVRAGSFPVVVGAALLFIPEEPRAARTSMQPGAGYTINPPYQSSSFLGSSNFKTVKFAITTCRWARTEVYLTKKPLKLHYPERTVTATVPDSLNLADPATVNGLLVTAWQTVWERCPAIADVDGPLRPEFGGVRVIVVQKKNVAIDTERTVVASNGTIATPRIENTVMEREVERLRQQEEAAQLVTNAIATRQRQLAPEPTSLSATSVAGEILGNLFKMFLTILAIVGLYKLIRNLPKIIGYLLYALMPHPAGAVIDPATRRDLSRPLDGPALADALRYDPSTRTERSLATEDLRKMNEEVRQETEYLNESEKLARMAIEMERQRARVEALKKEKDRS